jgi:hypothetical protein
VFVGLFVFFWFLLVVHFLCLRFCLCFVFVFLGERFYEGLISILDSGVFGPVV